MDANFDLVTYEGASIFTRKKQVPANMLIFQISVFEKVCFGRKPCIFCINAMSSIMRITSEDGPSIRRAAVT